MPALPQYQVRYVTKPPASLDESADGPGWPEIAPLSPLSILASPEQIAPCPTTIKACFDDQNLYLYFHCTDSEIIATHTQRDDPLWSEDVVEAFICPDGNLGRYYEFNFSPRGVIFDAIVTNPDHKRGEGFAPDLSWNAEGVDLHVVGRGRFYGNAEKDQWWSVRAAIPFADLDLEAPADGQQWRINLFRIERAGGKDLYCTWSSMPEFGKGYHQSERFGTFIFRR